MPIQGSDEVKRTNEIGMAIPLLDGCDIEGKIVTGDARVNSSCQYSLYEPMG